MKKDKCPVRGTVCNKCGKMNHFKSKCHETSNYSARLGPILLKALNSTDKGRVNQVDESSSSDDCNREWCNCISISNKKPVKYKRLRLPYGINGARKRGMGSEWEGGREGRTDEGREGRE